MTDAIVETLQTPDGPFMVLVDDEGAVLSSGWTADLDTLVGRIRPDARPDRVTQADTGVAGVVDAYYTGDLRAIDDVAVRQVGTDLQTRGWRALREIPPGVPLTYTEFAAVLGNAGAVRAAAGICARNAPALFVPCHRVLRSDGSMGGFAWGVEVKRSLLAREGGIETVGLF